MMAKQIATGNEIPVSGEQNSTSTLTVFGDGMFGQPHLRRHSVNNLARATQGHLMSSSSMQTESPMVIPIVILPEQTLTTCLLYTSDAADE